MNEATQDSSESVSEPETETTVPIRGEVVQTAKINERTSSGVSGDCKAEELYPKNPSTEIGSGKNPLSTANTSDYERAELLIEYTEMISNIAPAIKLMPLGDEGKNPIIKGNCRLKSDQAQDYLHTPEEAADAMRDGYPGFVLYAGRSDHGTGDLCFTDRDDPALWPLNDTPATVTVLSGSGRGFHETYVNAGNVKNASAKGDMNGAGEVLAENLNVVLPGSIHPSGGVYHMIENPGVGKLSSEDLPQEILPAAASLSQDFDLSFLEVGKSHVARMEAWINDFHADSATSKRAMDYLNDLMRGRYRKRGFTTEEGDADRSDAEAAYASKLYGIALNYGNADIEMTLRAVHSFITKSCKERKWTDDGQPRKWAIRGEDYRSRTLNAVSQAHSDDLFEKWQRKRDEWETWSDDYSDLTYQFVLKAVHRLAKEGAGYPTKTEIVTQADELNPGERSNSSYRNALSRLQNEHGQVKMAYLGGNSYVYYPKSLSDPAGANWSKIRGTKMPVP